MNKTQQIGHLIKQINRSGSNLFIVGARLIYYKIRGKNIIPHQKVIIQGLKNIKTKDNFLWVGIDYVDFTHNRDTTYLNVRGKLEIEGSFAIGRGCRLDIGDNAVVKLGNASYINPFCKLIISNGLHIGNNCSISWECQFVDNDFHQLNYEGKKNKENNAGIYIGNNVWIGSYVHIYKGVHIPNGCVIASNSVVKDKFEEENVLIAGNPAKIIKRNISWE